MAVTMIASPSRNRGALLALLLSCPSSPPLAGEPVISEFMADNTDTLRDADQDTSDWIEIHNPGPGPAQLGGWHLSDDAENLTRWTFPAGIEVAAGAYLLVFASGKDRGAPTEFFDARDSGDFAHALEFEDGRVPSAAGRADGWQERGLVPDATEPPSLAIRDGALLFDTLGALGENSIRLGPTLSAWNDEVGRETSYTVEVRVRVTEQGGDAPGFNLWGGSGKFEHSAFVSVELDRVIYGVATEPELARVLHSGDNSTEFVTLRLAQDGTTGQTYVWRNDILIGARLGRGISSSRDWLLLIDHGRSTECRGELDYVRWDATGVYAPPGTRIPPELHTDFKLSSAGEFLALSRPGGSAIAAAFAPEFPPQKPDVSYGPGGFFLAPSPGFRGSEPVSGFAAEPRFSVERGFFEKSITVTVESDTPGARVLYTTNGDDPRGEGAGTVASEPIRMARTTVLRAVAVRDDLGSSRVVAHTYLFPADVLTQTGAGFPVNPDWHYEVDPALVADPRFGDRLVDHLRTLPALSISLPVAELFGPNGIHANPLEAGMAWERGCSVEWLDPAGKEGFDINAGLRLHGAGSRFHALGKKSFRLAFRARYGPRKLAFPLFGPDAAQEFNTIVLRGNFFDSFSVSYPGDGESSGWLAALLLRDRFGYSSQWATGHHSIRGRWVHLYLDGLYWGLYHVTERPDEHFAASYFGGDPDDYDVLKQRPRGTPNGSAPEVVQGDLECWNALLELVRGGAPDLGEPGVYAQVARALDLESFVDYVILNLYGGNQDWPHNNWVAIRNRKSDGPFRFISWDAEHFIWRLAEDGKLETNVDNSPGILYDRLRRNPEFRLLFSDRVERHLRGSGALTPLVARERFDGLVAEILEAMDGESVRWGGTHVPEALNTFDNWLATVEDKRGRYFPERTAVVLEQFRSIGLLSPVLAPTLSQTGGAVPFGFELLLDAPQGDVWVTTDGSDPRLPGGAPSAAAKRVRSLVLEASTRVRARALVGDTWSPLVEADFVVAPSDAGTQRPGDANGDAAVNVADVIVLLGHLVLGEAPRLPCGDGSLRAPANRTLLDSNTDGRVDLADALYILDFLFRSGPAPRGGDRCVLLVGCPRSCAE